MWCAFAEQRKLIGNERGACGGFCNRERSSLVVDLDGDGLLDVLTRRIFEGELVALLGRGDGKVGRVLRHHPGFRMDALVAGDLDGDGDLDVVASHDRADGAILINCSR